VQRLVVESHLAIRHRRTIPVRPAARTIGSRIMRYRIEVGERYRHSR